MSDAAEWEPLDYFDIRKGDVVLIITTAENDAPGREASAPLLAEGWCPVLKVGVKDRDTRLFRLTVPDDPGADQAGMEEDG